MLYYPRKGGYTMKIKYWSNLLGNVMDVLWKAVANVTMICGIIIGILATAVIAKGFLIILF